MAACRALSTIHIKGRFCCTLKPRAALPLSDHVLDNFNLPQTGHTPVDAMLRTATKAASLLELCQMHTDLWRTGIQALEGLRLEPRCLAPLASLFSTQAPKVSAHSSSVAELLASSLARS